MAELKKAVGKRSITDTNLLLTITIVVFAAMYLFAMFGLGRGFLRWQTFFNILNTNAAASTSPSAASSDSSPCAAP